MKRTFTVPVTLKNMYFNHCATPCKKFAHSSDITSIKIIHKGVINPIIILIIINRG